MKVVESKSLLRFVVLIGVSVCIGVGLPLDVQADAYRWVDSKGQVHFGDRAPVGVKAKTVSLPEVNVSPAVSVDDAERWRRQQSIARTLADERKQREKTRKDAIAKKAEQKLACKKFKIRLKETERVNIYYRRNEEGERELLSDQERNALVEAARQRYFDACKK